MLQINSYHSQTGISYDQKPQKAKKISRKIAICATDSDSNISVEMAPNENRYGDLYDQNLKKPERGKLRTDACETKTLGNKSKVCKEMVTPAISKLEKNLRYGGKQLSL